MNLENIERSFNPRLAVDNYESYLKNSSKKAKLAETILNGKKNINYGNSDLQKLMLSIIQEDQEPLDPKD